jgi:hypothetical protein
MEKFKTVIPGLKEFSPVILGKESFFIGLIYK